MIGIEEIRQMYAESTGPQAARLAGSPQWELEAMADVCDYAIKAHDLLKRLETHDHDGYDVCPDCGAWYDDDADPPHQPHDDDCVLALLIGAKREDHE